MTPETFTWVDAEGQPHPWPYGKVSGCTGLGMAPVTHTSTSTIGIPGSQFQATRYAKRRIVIPLVLDGTAAQARDQLRSWAHWLDTTISEGWLQVHTLLGETRQIKASYAGGLELTVEQEHYVEAQISLDCMDPFFYDVAPVDLPLGVVATVTGDVAVWPMWAVRRLDGGYISTNNAYVAMNGPALPNNGPEGDTWGYRTFCMPSTMTERTMICDARPETRGVFSSAASFTDPLAAYLADPSQFQVPAIGDNDPYQLWYRIPDDPYFATEIPHGPGTTMLVTGARVNTAPYPHLSIGDYVIQCRYFPGWLTA